MKEKKTSPLRERMIEDMRIRGMSPKTQQGHVRAVRYFAEFIGRSPDTAMPDELCAYQLHMTDTGVSTSVFNARIVSLRFFFGMTCGREQSGGGKEDDPVNPFPAKRGTCSSGASRRSCPLS